MTELILNSHGGARVELDEISAPVFDIIYDNLLRRRNDAATYMKAIIDGELAQMDDYIGSFHER